MTCERRVGVQYILCWSRQEYGAYLNNLSFSYVYII